MCKFTNRLFIFVLLTTAAGDYWLRFIECSITKPRGSVGAGVGNRAGLLDILYEDYNDYQGGDEMLHYDERQKGEENFRLKLDGFLFALPSSAGQDWLDLIEAPQVSELLAELNTATIEKHTQKPEALTTTPKTNTPQMQQHLDADPSAAVTTNSAPTKLPEARNRADFLSNEPVGNGSRTKLHIMQLLNVLRRPTKY